MPGKKRVCVIGAGPSGMSALYHFDKLKKQGTEIPEVICYEKQSSCGGLWNYNWRTGTDEFGEVVHNSMYRNLWSNAPREAIEYPDYTFDKHFGRTIPSYPPRPVLFDYLKGRWAKADFQSWIKLNHTVQDVQYNESTDNFTVKVKDCANDRYTPAETFDYVIVATGHFSVPHLPDFPGLNKFPGRVMHSHNFRDAREFKDKRVLLIGSSYSAEDLALQLTKFGGGDVICTYRTRPMGFNWPSNVSERPLLVKVDGKTVYFKDGSTAEVDAIILCTGYLFSYPFLKDDDLRLKTENVLYPDGLYKNTLWTKGGNSKLMYIGAQDQCYTYTLFDVQARWCAKYIVGDIALPSQAAMEEDIGKWMSRNQSCKDSHDAIDFQTDVMTDIGKDSDYGYDLDVAEPFHIWVGHKQENIATYRDHAFKSKFAGTQAPLHHTPFMKAMDDSIECFLKVE